MKGVNIEEYVKDGESNRWFCDDLSLKNSQRVRWDAEFEEIFKK